MIEARMIEARIEEADWKQVAADLDERGHAVIERLKTTLYPHLAPGLDFTGGEFAKGLADLKTIAER